MLHNSLRSIFFDYTFAIQPDDFQVAFAVRFVIESPRKTLALAFVEAAEVLPLLQDGLYKSYMENLRASLVYSRSTKELQEIQWQNFKAALGVLAEVIFKGLPKELQRQAMRLRVATDKSYISPLSLDEAATRELLKVTEQFRESAFILQAALCRWNRRDESCRDTLGSLLDLLENQSLTSHCRDMLGRSRRALETPTKTAMRDLLADLNRHVQDHEASNLRSLLDVVSDYLDVKAKSDRVQQALLIIENMSACDVVFNPRTKIGRYILRIAHGKFLSKEAIETCISVLETQGMSGGQFKEIAPLLRELWKLECEDNAEARLDGKTLHEVTSNRKKETTHLSGEDFWIKNTANQTEATAGRSVKRKLTGEASEAPHERSNSG